MPKSYPGSLERRGDSTRIRLSIHGKRHYITVPTTDRREVERIARLEYERLAGRVRRGESLLSPRFSELVDDYRERGMMNLSTGGREAYEKSLVVFGRYFVRRRTDPRIDRIRKRDVEDFLRWRGLQVSPHTVARDYRVLHRLFAWAVEQELVDVNVVGRVKAPRVEQREYTLLRSDADLDRLLEACGPRDMLRTFVVTALETGARSESEVLWLEWRDIDFAGRTITFAHGRDGRRLKDGESKVLPMSARLERTLREHAERYRLALHSPYVFAHPISRGRHKQGDRIQSLRSSFKAAVVRAGFDGMRVHDMRHSCATILLSRGHSIEKVSRFLGHSSIEMTRQYSHLVAEDLRELVEGPQARPAAS